jgi:uncharacterized membrane protein
MEAFSDGVLAIIITIMVLELHRPEDGDLHALRPLLPLFLSYVLSFIYIGIYWNNHHHLLQAADRVNGAVLWANLHLLFWLSLVPFATDWIGETHFSRWPVALYGLILLMAAVAYTILAVLLTRLHGHGSVLETARGRDTKSRVSLLLYLLAIPAALILPWLAVAAYATVALVWLIPDRRLERALL